MHEALGSAERRKEGREGERKGEGGKHVKRLMERNQYRGRQEINSKGDGLRTGTWREDGVPFLRWECR
jgi:hypothetical protein